MIFVVEGVVAVVPSGRAEKKQLVVVVLHQSVVGLEVTTRLGLLGLELGKRKIWMLESLLNTTLQSVTNTKFSKHRFWHCHENRLIKTIKTINVSVKSASLY